MEEYIFSSNKYSTHCRIFKIYT